LFSNLTIKELMMITMNQAGAGLPGKTGEKSGGGRDNNPPRSK